MLESDRRFQVAVQTSKMVGLTEYLLQSSPSEYLQATQHPFLAAAGQRTISTQLLSRWLTQDRFYALHGYPALIGRLIRYIRFPARGGNDPTYAWEEDLLKMLSEFMSNIVRETRFFKDVAAKYGLDLEVGGLEPNTQEYCDLMRGTDEDVSDGLTEALVLLWAMEKCYLDAWSYASRMTKVPSTSGGVAVPNEALDELIGNWTSKEFIELVAVLDRVVNESFEKEGAGEKLRDRCTQVYEKVLELEYKFWPNLE